MCDPTPLRASVHGADDHAGPWPRRRFLATLGAVLIAGGCGGRRDSQGVTYVVQEGDTLAALSRRSGVSIPEIVARNGLRSRHLEPGTRLYLPGIDALPAPAESHHPAGSGHYQFVRRSQWGAEAMGLNHDPMRGINRLTLHHTAEIPGMDHLDDAGLMLAMQRLHQSKGWADIGYHYVLGRDGTVFEGRPLHAQGAHVKDQNEHNLGISVMGDYEMNRPTSRQLTVLGNIFDEQRARYRVPVDRVLAHREIGNTVCPGRHLQNWLDEFRNRSSV